MSLLKSNSEYSPKPFLRSYRLIEELSDFFYAIRDVADQYIYVSATERRCFNLIARFLPDLGNLFSNSGLMLQYKKIAEYYEENHDLPRILIVDDIMIHGRGVAKFLYQLEQLLNNELVFRGVIQNDEDRFDFRRRFNRAISIYIYARNRGTLFIEDRFIQKITCWKSMYTGELRDLSLQLSDSLIRWEISNTSFACSMYNNDLSNLLIQQQNNVKNNWVKILWKYEEEDMIFYFRLFGENNTNRISTIRLFPSRCNSEPPQITSFSIFGNLSKAILDEICTKTYNILRERKCDSLCAVLQEENEPILQYNRAQVISFLISSVDFFDFLNDSVPNDEQQKLTENLKYDFNKIACNFGKKDILRRELSVIAAFSDVRDQIKRDIYPLIRSNASPLLDLAPQDYEYTDLSTAKQEDIQGSINRYAENIFYNVGFESEQLAHQMRKKAYLFSPGEYQNYTFANEKFGHDGVISFIDFNSIVNKNKKSEIRKHIYSYLAAFISLMDIGVMGVRLHYNQSQKTLTTLAKAGEMAMFYTPRRFSICIPAFALIEDHSYRLGMSGQEAILKFASERTSLELPEEFNQEKINAWEKYIPNGESTTSLEELKDASDRLQRCGQSFKGWNFENLTYQDDPLKREYQDFLLAKAKVFLRM